MMQDQASPGHSEAIKLVPWKIRITLETLTSYELWQQQNGFLEPQLSDWILLHCSGSQHYWSNTLTEITNQINSTRQLLAAVNYISMDFTDSALSDRIKAVKVMGLQPPAPPSLQPAGLPRGLQGVNNAARTKAAPTPGTSSSRPSFAATKAWNHSTTKAAEILPSQSSLKLLSMTTYLVPGPHSAETKPCSPAVPSLSSPTPNHTPLPLFSPWHNHPNTIWNGYSVTFMIKGI